MSAAAQDIIAKVRAEISAQNWSGAQKLLSAAPTERPDWTPQENDEVICLAEYLRSLEDPAFT